MKRFTGKSTVRFSLLGVAALSLAACAETRREYKFFLDMHYSPAGDTAKFDGIGKRQYDMLEPENTITYNGAPAYRYKKDIDAEAAARELKAPDRKSVV